jgi:tyrosine-protein phosphatase non-receptor type 23
LNFESNYLLQYIRDVYHEDPETYSNEVHTLEGLRAVAVCAVRDVTGCSALKRYYCQLHFLQSRFPMAKDGAAAVPFTW